MGKKYHVENCLDLLLKTYNKDVIEGFNCCIFQYDINYVPIANTVYENGDKSNFKHDSLILLPTGHKPTEDPLRTEEGQCTPVYLIYEGGPGDLGPDCTVTYLAEYTYAPFTGCLFSLTYVYLSSSCPGGGGDGSGSGNRSGSGSGSGGSGNEVSDESVSIVNEANFIRYIWSWPGYATDHCSLYDGDHCFKTSQGNPSEYYNAAGGVKIIRLWILP